MSSSAYAMLGFGFAVKEGSPLHWRIRSHSSDEPEDELAKMVFHGREDHGVMIEEVGYIEYRRYCVIIAESRIYTEWEATIVPPGRLVAPPGWRLMLDRFCVKHQIGTRDEGWVLAPYYG